MTAPARSLILGVGVGIIALTSPCVALAEELDRALELEGEGRLAEALDAFEIALVDPANCPNDFEVILEHLALLRFAAGDQDGALEAAVGLLSLAPDATSPGSAPPGLESIFEEASRRGDRQLQASFDFAPTVSHPQETPLEVMISGDAASLVVGAAIIDEGRRLDEGQGRDTIDLEIPEDAFNYGIARFSVELLSETGGTVWTSDPLEIRVREPQAEAHDALPNGPPISSGMLALGWSLLLGGAGAVGIGGWLVSVDGQPTGNVRFEGFTITDEELHETMAGGVVLTLVGAAAVVTGVILAIVRPLQRRAAARRSVAEQREFDLALQSQDDP